MHITIVGAGRAGSSFASALTRVGHVVDVAHRVAAPVAGSRTLEVLSPHPRVGSLHPLMALPSGSDADRLLGATYCVAGDELMRDVALSLAGRVITLRDDRRTIYHAAAVVVSNHLVALMGQVRTLAESIGLTLEDFMPLAEQTLVDVARFGP